MTRHLGVWRVTAALALWLCATGHVWACWADNFHTWLFTCEMSLPLSHKRSAPVLEVSIYDEAGELKEAGSWVAGRGGNWSRCAA